MKAGMFSDTGHRYRYNIFHRVDNWYSKQVKLNPFFDYIFFNSDTYEVAKDKVEIAEVYFRLMTDQVTHDRKVFAIMDFFGALGGVSRVLLSMCGLFYGGYARFESAFETNAQLYRIKTNQDIFKKDKNSKSNIQKMKVSVLTRIALFSHVSCIAPLIKCFRTKKQ